MATTFTNRDAVLVLVIGSSNSAGNTNRTQRDLTRTLGALDSRCKIWGRWNAGGSARFTPGGSYDWEAITATQNLNGTGVSPVYALAERYSNAIYESGASRSRVRSGGATIGGRPQGVYFVQYSASSSRATQDAASVNSAASWYPKAKNDTVNTAFETFVELYVNEAIDNLKADPEVDRVFLDCVYVISNESAAYASTTVFTNDNTVDELIPGMSMLHSELARRLNVPTVELAEVTVKPSSIFEKFVSASADTSGVPAVRDAYDNYAAMVKHPISVVDGTMFDIFTKQSGSPDFTFAPLSGNTASWNGTTEIFTIVVTNPSGPNFNNTYAVGDPVTFDLLLTVNGQTAGTGIVSAATADTLTLEDVSFTAGTPGGDINSDVFTIGTNETSSDAADTDLNHYTGQGILQMGESLFQARRDMDAGLPFVFDVDTAEIEGIDSNL